MQEGFGWSLDEYIWFGGYPGAAEFIRDEWRWKEYVRQALIEPSITKDILMMQRVDKPALLQRLFTIGCSYSAQILALNKIQGELNEKGNLATLSNYLKLLSSAGLLCGLEKFAGNIIRKRASKPKFQVYNNALLSAQSTLTIDSVRPDGFITSAMLSQVGHHNTTRRDDARTCFHSTLSALRNKHTSSSLKCRQRITTNASQLKNCDKKGKIFGG